MDRRENGGHMAYRDGIESISGTIEFEDGRKHSFSIGEDAGWSQWGAGEGQLGQSVEALDVMARGLAENGFLIDEPPRCDTCGERAEDYAEDFEPGDDCPADECGGTFA
jgi:hypothetical protein